MVRDWEWCTCRNKSCSRKKVYKKYLALETELNAIPKYGVKVMNRNKVSVNKYFFTVITLDMADQTV